MLPDLEFHFHFKRPKAADAARTSVQRRRAARFHRDHWDAAEELYEKPPLIGRLMR
jgi:hypothetical protein